MSDDRRTIDLSDDVGGRRFHGSPAALSQNRVVQNQVRVAVAVAAVHDLAVVGLVRHVDQKGPRCAWDHRCRSGDDGGFDADGRIRVARGECCGDGGDRVVLDVVVSHDEEVEVAGTGHEVAENG